MKILELEEKEEMVVVSDVVGFFDSNLIHV